jgi:hypothetical protein
MIEQTLHHEGQYACGDCDIDEPVPDRRRIGGRVWDSRRPVAAADSDLDFRFHI